MKRFENKKVIVTGGTKGIGFAIAKHFLEEGATVAILGRCSIRGEAAIKELSGDVSFYAVDVSKQREVKDFSVMLLERWGNIDILVNNAGISKNSLILRVSEEEWDQVIDTNLKSVYNMTHVFSRNIIKNKNGRIINITSIAGGVVGGNPGQAHYGASKAAIVSFTKVVAKEFAGRGVTVNCVAPGYTDTEMIDFLSEENRTKVKEMIPMKRFAHASEIADAVLFLASDKASYITGLTLVVDGGLTA